MKGQLTPMEELMPASGASGCEDVTGCLVLSLCTVLVLVVPIPGWSLEDRDVDGLVSNH